LVRENPEYNENWDDFLSSNAGVMLTEIFAWITDQLATRIDWVVNENFIGTATQRGSIINLLKLIGYKFNLPASAEVPVEVKFTDIVGLYTLTEEYNIITGEYSPKTMTAKDKKGNTKFFEAVYYNSATQKYNYNLPIEVDTSSNLTHTIDFYEGLTRIEDFESHTNQGQKFTLSKSPVVRGSIIVSLRTTVDESPVETQLLEVDSFLTLEAQQTTNADGSSNEIPYVVNVLEGDAVEISFGSASLLTNQERRLVEGQKIKIFYRIGGGLDGEIARYAINFTEEVTGTSIAYKNNTEGVGGIDSETIQHAAYAGPLQIKTAGKTVTEEDYDIILSSFVNVLLSKAYGHNNIPSDFWNKYGIYINPLEVLNFVIIKNSGWEEIPTSKYKYANWGTFNLENYFNEKIAFNEGVFGESLALNAGNELTLTGKYDYDNQGGREFYNFMVIATPQEWKDSIWIENPTSPVLSDVEPYTNDVADYIANPDLKASLTTVDYYEGTYQSIEDIEPHLVSDNSNDYYLYGNYNSTGLPRPELVQDISAYFQSKKDVSLGVFIGEPTTGHNRLNLDIDGHGPVEVDLSNFGMNSGLVALSGEIDPDAYPAEPGSIIDVINSHIYDAYGDIYSYQDFGVLIPDTAAIIESLEFIEEQWWNLNIGDITISPSHNINFLVNTGFEQTYDESLASMNAAFAVAGTSGYQDLQHSMADPYTVDDGTAYDFNLALNGDVPVLVTLAALVLEAGAGNNQANTLELTKAELVDLMNDAFIAQDILATAKIVDVSAVDEIRIYANETGETTSIDISAGGTGSDLLAVVAPADLEIAVAGAGIAGCNLEATFVQYSDNIGCSDIRISRTSRTGKVLLADSGTSTDILAAYGALPLTTIPVDWGDYSEVATVVPVPDSTKKYIRLSSPNLGAASTIKIKITASGINRDATSETFDLDFGLDNVEEYNCYGQRKITVIFADTGEPDFGNFIYEHGTINFNNVGDNIDPQYIWLNYISNRKDTIRLGSYYTDNFAETDPEWKLAGHRVYNTIYEVDTDAIDPLTEKINYDVSNMLVKFTKDEIADNSIYVIDENILNEKVPLEISSYPTVTSIDLSVMTFPDDFSAKRLKIAVNENAAIPILLDDIPTIAELALKLNETWNDQANEYEGGSNQFVSHNVTDNTITITTDNKTNTGKIVIYDDETNLLGATIFNQTPDENTIIYPAGDYYLEHFIPDENGTLEEQFGYFNIKIIPNSENNIPDLSFYVHFVEDRRHNFLLNKAATENVVYDIRTDEDDLLDQLSQYKIAGVENSFKKPVFSTFDCRATIYINTASSTARVKQDVDTALRVFYSLKNTVLSKNVNKSEFIGLVLDVTGVRYIDITYFGNDYSNSSVYKNQDLEIVADFDEILVLSDDVYSDGGEQTNGLILQYTTL
jgi:hypothetical protein